MSSAYQPTQVRLGILLMLTGGLAFTGLDATLVHFAQTAEELSAPQRVFFRNVVGMPLISLAAYLLMRRERRAWIWRFPGWRIALFRGVLGFSVAQCFFIALERIGLGNAVLFSFSYPLVITMLSWPLLGDRVGVWRTSAVLVGFIGLALATRGLDTGDSQLDLVGVGFALAGGIAFALLMMSLRLIPKDQPSEQIIIYGQTVTLICSTLFVFIFFPLPETWAQSLANARLDLLGIAVFGTVGVLAISFAFRMAPAVVLAPLDYLVILWAFGLDWLLFGHRPSPIVGLGALFIIGSGLLILWRERVRAAPQGKVKRNRMH